MWNLEIANVRFPGGRGLLGLIFAILWPIIDPILVTFGQTCNFRDPNLVTFYLRVYYIE